MIREVFVIFVVSLTLQRSNGHTYSLGDCPVIDPMTPFNMNRMLGIWYVIQKTSTASTCITYNFTKLEEPDEYELEQISQHFFLGLTPLSHEYHYTGRLSVPDTSVPARMKVKFPLNVIGKASFTVFMTDYDTYAGIYTCQGLGIGHRESATILSRTRTLDKVFVDKIRTRLASYNIDPFDLSIISQKNCPKNKNGTEGLNINIDDDTFSAQSVAGVIRKAGEKLGDGVEYVAGGAKKLYSSYTNDGTASNGQSSGYEQQSGQKIEGAAEYIPGGAQSVYMYNRQNSDKLQESSHRLYADVAGGGNNSQKSARMETGRIVNAGGEPVDASEWLP